MAHTNSSTFVVRVDHATLAASTTLLDDLAFLRENGYAPILVAPDRKSARDLVQTINRTSNDAVCVSGADAATIPAKGTDIGEVQTGLLTTLTAAGFLPILEPIGYAPFGGEIEVDANSLAAIIATATTASRALFFHANGGIADPMTSVTIGELTPAEALMLANDLRIEQDLRDMVRAAAMGVRGGVPAAQIVDGRIAHATIVEVLTHRHLGTQVAGAIYLGGPPRLA